MRSVPRSRGSHRARLSRALLPAGTLLVLLAVAGLLVVSPARATYSGNNVESYQWSNGFVTCLFAPTLPSVMVSASGLNGTGMGVGLDQVNEISPMGVTVASALLSTAAWIPTNASTPQWFLMNYSEDVNVSSTARPSVILGHAGLSIQFGLERAVPLAPVADQVSFQLFIQEWPWQNSGDTLALVVPLWSAYATSEHVVLASSTSPRVESVRTSNGQPLEFFEASPSAMTGTGAAVSVTPYSTLANGIATTTLTFGPGARGASALTYQATLGITPSTPVLGIPLYDYAAVAGGAGLVALLVGFGTRRVRGQPSDLTYVEESE